MEISKFSKNSVLVPIKIPENYHHSWCYFRWLATLQVTHSPYLYEGYEHYEEWRWAARIVVRIILAVALFRQELVRYNPHHPAEHGRLLHQDVEVVFAAHLSVPVVYCTFKAAGSLPSHLEQS